MSSIVEHHEREQERKSLNGYLEQLLNGEEITGAAAGITKQVIADGEESLSQKQEFVFNRDVREPFLNLKCEQCGTSIPYDDAYEALHGDQLCSGCKHDKAKFFAKD
ncbi:hypothetical protein ACRQ1B_03325 [Rhizobium panacihumi]|uniref:hypothetical protein n=1 Tax=Rhizobium panacihumi TaxID=2008450 RepID=UPI003D7B883D